jgi:gamma-glutamyltranspeptidase/glutathione hydrolase
MTKFSSNSRLKIFVGAAMLAGSALAVTAGPGASADLASQSCSNKPGAKNPAFCSAPRGDRSTGWLPQSRPEVMARNGIVATSQPLAAQAGLDMLKKGGNAIDAAVAAAAVLNLMEPMNEGMAGDLFTIIYTAKDHQLHALNASGITPAGLTLKFMNDHGYKWDPKNINPGSGMPKGVLQVTVPGAAWGWQEVLDKYGTMKFKDVLAPAAEYAEKGFPVSERIAADWHLPIGVNDDITQVEHCCTKIDPDSIRTWYINGKQPVAGQIYRNPDLAKTFRILMEKGRDGFYKGAVAQATVDKMRKLGSPVTMADFANYKGEWVTPVTSDYHGYTLAELPPPSNGFGANEMLSILAACTGKVYPGQTLASMGPKDPRYWHMLIEAKTLAYADLNASNGDPNQNKGMAAKVKMLTSAEHANSLCSKISPTKAMQLTTAGEGAGDTIVLTAADRWGNIVSWVNSNYASFGSGITVPGYGFVLHNRGGLFTLDPKSPNVIAGNKRPYNTLEAAMVLQNGRTDGQIMALTLMGGDMQAQGHAQMMVNMVDLGANVQAATDMARFHHSQNNGAIQMESEAFKLVGPQLKAMGHNITSANGGPMGGYQALLFTPDPSLPKPSMAANSKEPVNGYYRAGTDHRKDGMVAGW